MTMLSAIDAFFVAYQESSGVLMQVGVEVELKGRITRDDVERMLAHVVKRWPPLGQRLRQDWLGLSWTGKSGTNEMLRVAENREALAAWRNKPLNPFREPPFQLLWIPNEQQNLFAFRAHHAVVDGEAFFGVCAEALRALAGAEHYPPQAEVIPAVKVKDAFQKVQELRREAQSNKSARISVRSTTPGPIAIVARDLDRKPLGASPAWLCTAAWMKAIHAWNRSTGMATDSLISLEVPVSLRRNRDRGLCIGNQISPIVLYGDATEALEDLAQQLKQQMSRALRKQIHLALPAFSAPARFLPWEVFRRIVASPELTGFATSHFAWLEYAPTIHDEVSSVSGGALQLVDQQVYTPVCLHMGAAVSILAWPGRTQVFLTHRLNALSTNDANVLLDLMVDELVAQQLNRQQVAV